MEVPDGSSIRDVLELLAIPIQLSWTVTSINGVVKEKSALLVEGDVLFVVPVGGGG